MAKYQVRLLVLIALGTISRCQDVGGPPPESGAVIPSMPAFPSWDCGFSIPGNLRFGEMEVTIPGSGLVFHRVTVRDVHLDFATKTSVSLPSDSFLECAIAAAIAGFEAFVFEGNCTGYQLTTHFHKCQTGDLVVYVRADYLNQKPAVVPLDEAPFKSLEQNRRQYMLSSLVDIDDDHPALLDTKKVSFDFYYYNFNLIYRENGDTFFLNGNYVDMNFCLSDGAYGLLFDVHPTTYDFPGDIMYFFEECGNTVQLRQYIYPEYLLVLSHPGFGCKYYPSDLPDECTVTFQLEGSKLLTAAGFSFYFSETDSDDGGLNMTVTGKDPKTGKLERQNMYQKNSRQNMIFKSTIEISLLRQPSKRAIGFYVHLVPSFWGLTTK